MISYLAIGFILLLVATIFYGFSMVMRRPPTDLELKTEHCSLCRIPYDKKVLIEREVGDFKVLYFCETCIGELHRDLEAARKQTKAG